MKFKIEIFLKFYLKFYLCHFKLKQKNLWQLKFYVTDDIKSKMYIDIQKNATNSKLNNNLYMYIQLYRLKKGHQ